MDEPEGSSYESTISGSPEIKEKRWLPVPTVKGVFMFVGVVMIIGVLGMAGYIFYKGKADDERHLKGLFNGDPSCTTSHDIYQCEGDEQLQMFVSHLCMSNSKGGTCFDWRPQRLCLTSQSNRFRSVQECEENCNAGNNKCGPAATCECSGMYRKVNYIYDMRRQRCRLIPVHECAEVDVGFTDSDECESKCGSDTSKEDTRCKLAALEELVRPCLWEDKLYTHYFDAKSGKCQPWDESVCSSKVFRRLDKCFSGCSRGVIGDASQQENTTTGNTTTDRRVVRAQRAPPGAAKVIT
ncbi:hypothetical protein HPB49_001587 [Dermacentor silvarum]|uniref:Uncharacterized protein n=1 Tax=Dermacentor silvarum TaxID=543639 RepID=A0ACB8CJ25_DERSI|nr:hypothetical protein HPB49_001587 [Dermacentor silvarum]